MLFLAQNADSETAAGPQGSDPGVEYQSLLLTWAEENYRREDYATALRFYESGLALGPAPAIIYHHAGLAAHLSNNTPRALALLKEAVAKLGDSGMQGSMWYNMGCFATRLGHFDDAMYYLMQAVRRGCLNADEYRSDLDLAPLRWRDDFKQLLRSLPEHVRSSAR
jgi:tetratricopeptide (TPR) repeat protein